MGEHLQSVIRTEKLRTRLFQGCLVIGTSAIMTLAICAGNVRVLCLVMASLVALPLMGRPRGWLILVILISASGLKIPGALLSMSLFDMVTAGFVVLAVLLATQARMGFERTGAHAWLIALAAVILVTMTVRGVGFQALGGDMIGGASYIRVYVPLALVFLIRGVPLNTFQWRVALIGMCAASVLPLAVDLLLANGVGWGVLENLVTVAPPQDDFITWNLIPRLFGASNFSMYFCVGLCLVIPLIRIKTLFWIGVGIALILGGLSSHRLAIINILLFLLTLSIVRGRTRGRTPMIWGGAIVILGAIFLSASRLPLAMQRSLSWVPGIHISDRAAISAAETISWRVMVWQESLREVPSYWLIGKGYAFRQMDGLFSFSDNYQWAIVSNLYHNGPLSMLIGLGVAGLVCGIGFLGAMIRRHYVVAHSRWPDSALQHFHRCIFALFVTQATVFLFLYGDVQVSFPAVLFSAALLEGLVVSGKPEPLLRRDSTEL